MSSLIEQVAREAKATFSKDLTDPGFEDNFNKLVRYVSKLQASDVKLNESLETASNRVRRTFNCLYIEVFSSEAFIISIFILNSGVKIPLHDHPGMHGIVKVIKGTVKVSSYTSVADESGDQTVPQDLKNKVGRSQRSNAVFIPVTKHEPKLAGEKDPACVLRPKEGNFHEICAVGDMAVFLDVLAPPYDMVERDCTFYKALETAEQDAVIKTWLLKNPPGDKFYSSTLTYFGPKIKL